MWLASWLFLGHYLVHSLILQSVKLMIECRAPGALDHQPLAHTTHDRESKGAVTSGDGLAPPWHQRE